MNEMEDIPSDDHQDHQYYDIMGQVVAYGEDLCLATDARESCDLSTFHSFEALETKAGRKYIILNLNQEIARKPLTVVSVDRIGSNSSFKPARIVAVPEKSSGRKVPKKVLPEMKRVNKSNRVEIEDFVCPQCDQPYSNQDLLDKHMKVHGSTDGQPPRKSVTIMQPTIKSEPVEPNEKSRRRRYGPFVCPECKDSFSKQSRLDRHRGVHLKSEHFSCPLCDKVYRHEGVLIRHWRAKCQGLDSVVTAQNRLTMEVAELQALVHQLSEQRRTVAYEVPVDETQADQSYDLSGQILSANRVASRMSDDDSNIALRCKSCGLLVPEFNCQKHWDVHCGKAMVDEFDIFSETYFCDLCALAFETQEKLYVHWRGGCLEVFASLLPTEDVQKLDNAQLKGLIQELLNNKVDDNDTDGVCLAEVEEWAL